MSAFLAELKSDLRSKVPLIVWLTVSLAVAVSGPFGSYSALTLFERALFWPPVIGIGLLVGSVIRALVYGTLAIAHSIAGSMIVSGLICAAMCPPLYFVVQWVFDPMFGRAVNFVEIVLLVSTISLGVCSLRMSSEVVVAAPVANDAETPRLLRRLEPAFQGKLWAITVRDHYVDVQTSLGKSSLLMRFSDAIDEAHPCAGAQVHRSHWVAWEGVGSVCREGGKMNLHLHNGHQIPVSRNHREKVDARFPIADTAKEAAA